MLALMGRSPWDFGLWRAFSAARLPVAAGDAFWLEIHDPEMDVGFLFKVLTLNKKIKKLFV
ncbi:MAG: hypothetical protein HQL91_07955 [Magnetococcales bacterium]|nr:hypothetical protein [Magnetococcales bacterium]